jgi:hypothetical protein
MINRKTHRLDKPEAIKIIGEAKSNTFWRPINLSAKFLVRIKGSQKIFHPSEN